MLRVGQHAARFREADLGLRAHTVTGWKIQYGVMPVL